MLKSLIAAAAIILAAAGPAAAQQAPSPRECRGQACVELVDVVPRFLAFWEAAQAAPPADADARFALWKARYGFAAVPPGPRGEAMARTLLDKAWDRYAPAIPRIRAAVGNWNPAPVESLAAVARVLDYSGPVNVRVVHFVGGFEENAFAYAIGDVRVVNFPVEGNQDREIEQAHEFTHAVHSRTAGLSGGWERSIAQTLMQEGLAMQVARQVAPGRPVEAYVTHDPAWWAQVQAKKASILTDVVGALDAKDGASVWRFTIGTAAAGVTREAYAAGWWVIEQLRRQGMTLAQIARIPESDMARVSREAIGAILTAEGRPLSR